METAMARTANSTWMAASRHIGLLHDGWAMGDTSQREALWSAGACSRSGKEACFGVRARCLHPGESGFPK